VIRILFLASLVPALACSDLPDRPEPPDMSALVAAYANPSADLDQATADELAADLRARLDLSDALDHLESWVDDVLAPALEQDGGGTARRRDTTSSVRLEGDGFARIEHVCGGWGAEPVVDEDANGHLALTTTFTEAGFDPVIWGEAVECRTVIADHEVLLDGGVNLWIGENLAIDHFGDTPILFQLLATLEVDGESWADTDFDIQICPSSATSCEPGAIEIKLDVSAGDLVFYLAPGRTRGGFRAANGDWACTIDGSDAVCTNGDQSVSLTGILP
jgi:hypothetical protein